MNRAPWLLVASSLVGCDAAPRGPSDSSAAAAAQSATNLLESRVPRAVAGQDPWQYAERAKADFDGDGRQETAVLIADAFVGPRGPMWDHGHRWQVYIEEADATRTYVYARFLPNGKLEARVAVPGQDSLPTIVLQEITPYALGIYEVRYLGPGRILSLRHLHRELDRASFFAQDPLPK